MRRYEDVGRGGRAGGGALPPMVKVKLYTLYNLSEIYRATPSPLICPLKDALPNVYPCFIGSLVLLEKWIILYFSCSTILSGWNLSGTKNLKNGWFHLFQEIELNCFFNVDCNSSSKERYCLLCANPLWWSHTYRKGSSSLYLFFLLSKRSHNEVIF